MTHPADLAAAAASKSPTGSLGACPAGGGGVWLEQALIVGSHNKRAKQLM
jgi:hypothetical protein